MKKHKKTYFKFILFLTLIIFVAIIAYFMSDDEVVEMSNVEVVENVISDVFLTTDTSLEEIEEITEHELNSIFIATGENGFLRETIECNEDISKYKNMQNIYATKVEEKYINNTDYTVEELDNGNLFFQIKPYYFKTYASDVTVLASKLMKLAGVEDDLIEKNYDSYKVYAYKANIKAMMIMDEYLDNYNNKDEVLPFTFYFDGNEPAENQYLSLYFNLIGVTSEYMINSDIEHEEQDIRVEQYLNSAIDRGLVNKDNPLGI